ncbi:MAG: hypothetical protein Q7J47_21165 [Azoarcus sp.]|nr:hypothetical protein [Azoarcus sp.]
MCSIFGRVQRALGLAAVGTLLAACGDSGLSGEYIGRQGSWVDKLVFGPGNEVRAVDGRDEAAGVFRIEGKQVILTIGTDQSALTIADSGCLDGGRQAGVYCKR